ncbi:MAG: hypothetical protein M5U19_04965 [Microthrixaceae bacterium]|nr:hypothetical protein [Microthrixaceae bacterium]
MAAFVAPMVRGSRPDEWNPALLRALDVHPAELPGCGASHRCRADRALGVVAVLAAALVVSTLGWRAHHATLGSLRLTATACLGFGFLGLLDDLAIDHGTSGYRGHIEALRQGNLSAGALKMLIGPLVALVVVFPSSGGSFCS